MCGWLQAGAFPTAGRSWIQYAKLVGWLLGSLVGWLVGLPSENFPLPEVGIFLSQNFPLPEKWASARATGSGRNRYIGALSPIWYCNLQYIVKLRSTRGAVGVEKTNMKSSSTTLKRGRHQGTALRQS